MGFFKAYDMRGTFGRDFDLDMVYRVGRALPQVVAGGRWLVGRDGRASSPAVCAALVAGLKAAGCDVTELGPCTTPMVYFFTAEDGYDGSVMVTASHNPPGDNGLKVSKRGALPVGYADGLDRVEALVKADAATCPGEIAASTGDSLNGDCGADGVRALPYLARYIAWQKAHSTLAAPRSARDPRARRSDGVTSSCGGGPTNLRYAVDCSNGMASILAHEMFPGAVFLNDTVDGGFPCHAPNPLIAEAREQVAAAVREQGLDCGLIFDGDADRCMFVDEKGDFVQPDYLIPVIARATGAAAGEAVVHDVRTSRGAIEALAEMGCRPLMVPVGHAFAKPALRASGGPCGGELAGHYYFREFAACDSGVLAATRVLGEVAAAKARGETFSQMMRPIAGRYANSGEINFKVEDKDAAIARILARAAEIFPAERSRSTIDGIRVEYDDGWLNVRKSNTEPYLRLVVECGDAAGPAASAAKLAARVAALRAAVERTPAAAAL